MSSLDGTIVATALPAIQHGLRSSINWTSWVITAYSVGQVLAYPLAGKLSDRVGTRPVLMFGLVLAAAGVIALAVVEGPTSTWLDFLLPATVIGVGMGCVFAPLLAEAMRDVPTEMLGSAAGLLTTARQVGSALGTAVVGAVLQNRVAAALHEPAAGAAVTISGHLRGVLADAYVAAMRPSLAIPALALLLGAATCAWIRRSGEAAETPSWTPNPNPIPSPEAV